MQFCAALVRTHSPLRPEFRNQDGMCVELFRLLFLQPAAAASAGTSIDPQSLVQKAHYCLCGLAWPGAHAPGRDWDPRIEPCSSLRAAIEHSLTERGHRGVGPSCAQTIQARFCTVGCRAHSGLPEGGGDPVSGRTFRVTVAALALFIVLLLLHIAAAD
jgi:hypothetical protein